MSSPPTPLLTILETLQAHGQVSSQELAERLSVDPGSVRQYVTMLQELGIPVKAARGSGVVTGFHLAIPCLP
jgi:predicted DNA-binding transcriptional regulator YafY